MSDRFNTATRFSASQSYIARGWHILPLISRDKRPYKTLAELPYRSRKLTPDECKSFFVSGDNNVGIVTGKPSGLVVIDIDKPELAPVYLEKYPTNLVATTPRGGTHLYYKYIGGDIGNSTSFLDIGVDVRGDGGYVVACPSLVDYGSGFLGQYYWQEYGEPSDLPNDLVNRLKNGVTPSLETPIKKDDARNSAYKIIRDGFTEGRHNEELRDFTRYLYRHGLQEGEIVNIVSALNAKDATPQSQYQLEATIRSAIGYEKKRLENSAAVPNSGFNLIGVNELLSTYGDDYNVEWLIQDWLPKNSLLVLAAPPENYKTWLLLEAAIVVALGGKAHPFMGQFEQETCGSPVIIVQQEDFQGQVAQRIRTIIMSKSAGICRDFGVDYEPDGTEVFVFDSPFFAPIYIHPDANLTFETPESVMALEAKIIETGAKLVVIDPLYMLDNSDDYFASLARKLKLLKRMREQHGVSFLIAHHNRKGGGDGRQQIFGSVLLNGAFEGAWLLTKTDGTVTIERSGKFFTDKRKFVLEFEIDTTPGKEVYKVVAEDVTATIDTGYKNDRPVFDLLKEHSGGLKQSDIAEELGLASKVISDSLKRLKDKGFVIKAGRLWLLPKEIPYV